jgi:hypothetical protein
MCDKCGLNYIKDGQNYCYKTQNAINTQQTECNFFIDIRYDGDEPYSPEQHLYFLQADIESKKMKNMQGMRF